MGVAKADLSDADSTGLVASPGDGNDVVEGSSLAETNEGLGGNDILIGAGDDVWLGGHVADDVVNGDAGNDILSGVAGNDALSRGAGDDVI